MYAETTKFSNYLQCNYVLLKKKLCVLNFFDSIYGSYLQVRMSCFVYLVSSNLELKEYVPRNFWREGRG